MSRSLAIVCEARADWETACALADRMLCDEVKWIDTEALDDFRRWRGFLESDPFLPVKRVRELAQQHNIRAHGKFDGDSIAPDEHFGRRVLLLLYSLKPPPDAVLLIRDDDRQTERRLGLERARKYAQEKLREFKTVVLGLAHPKRECWVLAGFDPRNEEETRLLDGFRQKFGFNPCTAAEQLTATGDQDKKSAKRVLRELTRDDKNRQAECWTLASLEILHQRGQQTGLADYLGELRTLLAPLFR